MAFKHFDDVHWRSSATAFFPRMSVEDPGGGPAYWVTFPRRTEMLVAAIIQANTDATWARWSPDAGTSRHIGFLQVDEELAAAASWSNAI
jgi:hypothetical protein